VEVDIELTAQLLAAMDLLPAEKNDLSALLIKLGPRGLTEPVEVTSYATGLAKYLRDNVDDCRIKFWLRELVRMSLEIPDASAISVIDNTYPSNLLDCFDLPPILFFRGTVSSDDNSSIAIVGSRKASSFELRTAAKLARIAGEANITVVSGLAAGVDEQAHQGALHVGGRTLAIIGCGLDRLAGNLELSSRICRNGAVLTPYRPGSPTTRSSLVARNAVISGLSLVSVVVAAGPQSGSFSEAEAAVRQGRRVLFWAPSLEGQPWARIFVESNPRVSFFDDPTEIVKLTSREAETMNRKR
jgi:DNA processing protein